MILIYRDAPNTGLTHPRKKAMAYNKQDITCRREEDHEERNKSMKTAVRLEKRERRRRGMVSKWEGNLMKERLR